MQKAIWLLRACFVLHGACLLMFQILHHRICECCRHYLQDLLSISYVTSFCLKNVCMTFKRLFFQNNIVLSKYIFATKMKYKKKILQQIYTCLIIQKYTVTAFTSIIYYKMQGRSPSYIFAFIFIWFFNYISKVRLFYFLFSFIYIFKLKEYYLHYLLLYTIAYYLLLYTG